MDDREWATKSDPGARENVGRRASEPPSPPTPEWATLTSDLSPAEVREIEIEWRIRMTLDVFHRLNSEEYKRTGEVASSELAGMWTAAAIIVSTPR